MRTGARIAWIPRRAGERAALEAGCLPNLFAGGRPIADDHARAQAATAWNVIDLPPRPGRDTSAILAAARTGELGALLIGGVEPADLPDPAAALAAIDAAPFVVSLELRESAVTELADVVFPVAPVVEKSGAFLDWEGRIRPFEAALPTNATSDARVLQILADELGIDLAVDSDDGRVGRSWRPARRMSRHAPRRRAPAKRCCRPGECCWTPGGYRTVSPIWPAPRGRRWRDCRAATAAEIRGRR